MVALTGQSSRATHHFDATKLAKGIADASFSRGMIGIELHVAGDEQIQPSIMIVVAPSRSRGPSAQSYSGFLRNVGKCAVVFVVAEPILAIVGHVDIWPAIVVIVTYSYTKTPAFIGNAGFFGNICKRAITIIVEQHCTLRLFFAFQGGKS